MSFDLRKSHTLKNSTSERIRKTKKRKREIALKKVAENDCADGEEEMGKFSDSENFEPFNLKEEREDGYFDKHGNYIADEDKDEWIASLNESETKKFPKPIYKNQHSRQSEIPPEPERDPLQIELLEHRKKISALFESDCETVGECLSRIGKGKDKKLLNELLESIDQVSIVFGDLDVYQDTFTSLCKKIVMDEEKIEKAKLLNSSKNGSKNGAKDCSKDNSKDSSKDISKDASKNISENAKNTVFLRPSKRCAPKKFDIFKEIKDFDNERKDLGENLNIESKEGYKGKGGTVFADLEASGDGEKNE